ncbi:VOC family protein [bacterium]|nr:MAG: VOC family protein [bacterium]
MSDAGPPTGLLVNIDVGDLERAVEFYTAALGLTVGRRFRELAVELLGLPSPIYLLANPPGTAAIPGEPRRRRNYSRHWTPVHLDFVVDDVHAALARALDAGAHLDQPLKTRPFGQIAVLSDPFGNGFCLLEFSDAGYDEIASPA